MEQYVKKPLLIIVEGVKYLGKSSNLIPYLANKFDALCFGNDENQEYKPTLEWYDSAFTKSQHFTEMSYASANMYIDMLMRINHYTDRPIILDRFHLSMLVYTNIHRRDSLRYVFGTTKKLTKYVASIEKTMMSGFNVHLIGLDIDNMDTANDDIRVQEEEVAVFRHVFEHSLIKNKHIHKLTFDEGFTNISSVAKTVSERIKFTEKIDL